MLLHWHIFIISLQRQDIRVYEVLCYNTDKESLFKYDKEANTECFERNLDFVFALWKDVLLLRELIMERNIKVLNYYAVV